MRELRPFLSEHAAVRGRLVVGTALLAATLLSSVGLLAVSGWFITATALAGLAGAAMEVYRPSGAIRLFALTRTLSRYFERLVHHDAVLRVLARLRVRLFRTLLPQPLGVLRRLRATDWVNRLLADVDALDNLYLRILGPTLATAATVLVTSLLLFWALGAAAMPAAALLLLGGIALPWFAWQAGRVPGEGVDRYLPALRAQASDLVSGLAELHACRATERHRNQLLDASHGLITARKQAQRLAGAGEAATGLLAHGALAAALVAGLVLYQSGSVTGPMAALAALAALAAGEALGALPAAWQHLSRTRAAARRLLEHDTPSDGAPETGDAPAGADEAPPPVTLWNVTARHTPLAEPLLAGGTLRVHPGEHVLLQGASGAGKSSVLDLVAGLLVPESGRVTLGARAVHGIPETERFRRIGYLTQRTEYFADSVAGNLRLAAPQADDDTLWAALATAGLRARVAALPRGLHEWIGEGGVQLSGGEARRLALARLMLTDPEVVLLDEPYRGLDAATVVTVDAGVRQWLEGRTALIAAHQEAAAPACERVVTLRQQRFAAVR